MSPLADLPHGLGIVILAVSLAARAVVVWPAPYLIVCGLPQDLKAAMLLSLVCVPCGHRAVVLVGLLATLWLTLDVALRISSGVRTHLTILSFVFESGLRMPRPELHAAADPRPALHATVGEQWATLTKNLAMVPPATARVFTCWLLVAILWLLSNIARRRCRLTRSRLACLICVIGAAHLLERPCCDASSCSSEVADAQSPNGLHVLCADVWHSARSSTEESDAALQGDALAKRAIELHELGLPRYRPEVGRDEPMSRHEMAQDNTRRERAGARSHQPAPWTARDASGGKRLKGGRPRHPESSPASNGSSPASDGVEMRRRSGREAARGAARDLRRSNATRPRPISARRDVARREAMKRASGAPAAAVGHPSTAKGRIASAALPRLHSASADAPLGSQTRGHMETQAQIQKQAQIRKQGLARGHASFLPANGHAKRRDRHRDQDRDLRRDLRRDRHPAGLAAAEASDDADGGARTAPTAEQASKTRNIVLITLESVSSRGVRQ